MKKLTPELIEMAKKAGTVEELLAMARENGEEMTAEEAKAYFEQLNPRTGELSDDELDNVAGGGCGNDQPTFEDGDAAKLRDCISGYKGNCDSRRGTFHRSSSEWWLICDTPKCGCKIIRQRNDVVEAAFLEKL